MTIKSAGGILALFKSMLMDVRKRAGVDKESLVTGLFENYGFISGGWVVGTREVYDLKVSPFPFSSAMITGFEFTAEHGPSGIQTSEYYDLEGNLVGRKYFDRGDVKKRLMMKHLQGLDTNLKQGRPKIEDSLDLTSKEIVERIMTRNEWYVNSDNGGKYQPTVLDACEQLASELGLITHESTDMDAVKGTKIIYRIYMREQKRNK